MPIITRTDTDKNGNPAPHKYYVSGDSRVPEGKALPGCTSLAGHADSSSPDGLMTWAVNLFQDTGNRLEYKESNQLAQAVGKQLHAEIEEYISTGEVPQNASKLFGAWFSSVYENGVKFIAQEMLVYHPTLLYGGTLDAIGYVDGQPTLFDWKTTDEFRVKRDRETGRQKNEYERKRFNDNISYAVQLGGYMSALKEMAKTEKHIVPTQAYIVYVFKDTLKTEWVKINLKRAEELFEASVKIHHMTLGTKRGGLYE